MRAKNKDETENIIAEFDLTHRVCVVGEEEGRQKLQKGTEL